jgi:hypothetical protein
MYATVDLQLNITRLDQDSYHLEMQLRLPGEAAPLASQRSRLAFDFERLQALYRDPESYGRVLTQALFDNPDNRDYLVQSRRLAAESDLPLRLLLQLDPARFKLIGMRWETLRDPLDGSWLFGQESVQLVRRLHSPDWPPAIPLHAPSGSALAVIGCPQDLHGHSPWTVGLTVEAVDARQEAGLAALALASYQIHYLAGEPVGQHPVTPENLQSALCDEVDILYLVCPAALHLKAGDPGLYLFLEGESGAPQALPSERVLSILSGCNIPPLIILAAPQSLDGDGSWRQSDPLGALRRIVPGLLEIGARAVLAFNGAASQALLTEFMPAFLQSLRETGDANRALAGARALVRYRSDAWTPALFLREAQGNLWQVSDSQAANGTAAAPQANTWLVSASPERVNWLQAFAAGTILWDRSFGERARQVLAQVHPGDTVCVFSANPEDCLLGVGRVLSEPQPVSDWEGERLSVRLELHTRLSSPIPKASLAAAAPSLEILRSPFATFTPVTAEEWAALRIAIARDNPGVV